MTLGKSEAENELAPRDFEDEAEASDGLGGGVPRRYMRAPKASSLRDLFRPSAFELFIAAFMLLCGAAVAVALANFSTSRLAPWISISYSGAAILATIAAIIRAFRS